MLLHRYLAPFLDPLAIILAAVMYHWFLCHDEQNEVPSHIQPATHGSSGLLKLGY